MTSKTKLIIDTDVGLDDAHALLMALAEPNVEILAITTTHGNAGVDQVTQNVLRLLTVVNRLEVPVYKGCKTSLLDKKGRNSCFYHGHDGLGDAPDDSLVLDYSVIRDEHAVQAITTLINKYPGEVSVVCLGPLTNLAMALRLQPSVGSLMKNCFIMGGNYLGKGNITASAEYNFYCDPESAHIVLSDLTADLYLITWELTKDVELPWEICDQLHSIPTTRGRFLKKIFQNVRKLEKDHKWEKYVPCDEVAMAAALDSSIMNDVEDVFAVIELTGGITRGQCVIDWAGKLNKKSNVKLVKTIDEEKYKRLLFKAVEYE